MFASPKQPIARLSRVIMVLALCAMGGLYAKGQVADRRLSGHVRDATGSAISGVLIHVPDDAVQSYTNPGGDFVLHLSAEMLPGRRILITVEKKGWHLQNPTDKSNPTRLSIVLPGNPEMLDITLMKDKKIATVPSTTTAMIEPDEEPTQNSPCREADKTDAAKSGYFLDLSVQASFRSERFNTPTYLRSAAPLMIENTAVGRDDNAGVISSGKISYSRCIRLQKGGSSGDPLAISVHGRQFALDTGRLRWASIDPKRKLQFAAGRASLLLEDPDWGIMRSSRLLDIVNDPKEQDGRLLELLLENLSDTEIPLDEIRLTGATAGHGGSFVGNRLPQIVLLDLPAGIEQGATNVPTGFTELADVHTSVLLTYGPGHFSMKIPVQINLPPKQITRFSVKFFGHWGSLKTYELDRTFFLGWDRLYVSTDRDDLQPKLLEIDRSSLPN